MKTLAKIILASSLITLAACSGKGSGESRIHNIPSDEDENPAPQVIDDEEVFVFEHGNLFHDHKVTIILR